MSWWDDLFKPPETGEKAAAKIDEVQQSTARAGTIGAPARPGLDKVVVPSPADALTPHTPDAPPRQETPNSQREYDPRGRINPPPMPHMGRRVGPPLPAEVIVNVLSALQPIFVNAERFIRELPERIYSVGRGFVTTAAGVNDVWRFLLTDKYGTVGVAPSRERMIISAHVHGVNSHRATGIGVWPDSTWQAAAAANNYSVNDGVAGAAYGQYQIARPEIALIVYDTAGNVITYSSPAMLCLKYCRKHEATGIVAIGHGAGTMRGSGSVTELRLD